MYADDGTLIIEGDSRVELEVLASRAMRELLSW